VSDEPTEVEEDPDNGSDDEGLPADDAPEE